MSTNAWFHIVGLISAGLLGLGFVAGLVSVGLSWKANGELQTDLRRMDAKNLMLETDMTQEKKAIASVNAQAAEANRRAAEANKIAEEERLARVKLEARLATRSSLMSQAQQNELTARLSKFKDQRGTIIASPSTPESEWFVMVLAAPLRAAGWDITPLPGTSTATVLYPTGVVITYRSTGRVIPDPEPHAELAKTLNEWGISATVVSGPIKEPNTIEITVSEK
jgi:outer membrane murein-binding lipoprotein Lpp